MLLFGQTPCYVRINIVKLNIPQGRIIPTLNTHDLYTIKAAVDLSKQRHNCARKALRWCGMGLLRV